MLSSWPRDCARRLIRPRVKKAKHLNERLGRAAHAARLVKRCRLGNKAMSAHKSRKPYRRDIIAILTAIVVAAPGVVFAQPATPTLQLEAKIPLGNVRGRIDHMAVDLSRKRVFVAELGNGSVSVVDLQQQKVVHRITGLKEPQGVGYVPATETLYVANGGDGSVRLYRGSDYAEAGRIALRDDADNVRLESSGQNLFVGYRSEE